MPVKLSVQIAEGGIYLGTHYKSLFIKAGVLTQSRFFIMHWNEGCKTVAIFVASEGIIFSMHVIESWASFESSLLPSKLEALRMGSIIKKLRYNGNGGP